MSQFSGKCDLYDHIGFEKMYDKGGYSVSDELECFEIFKERTGGKLYQHRKVVVSEWNQKEVAAASEGCLTIKSENVSIPDKRQKSGFREETKYTYYYWGTEYKTLKELNKHGVYIKFTIPFNTILDIIEYYPYIVSSCYSGDGKEVVFISKQSFVDSEFEDALKSGLYRSYPLYYKQALAEHYMEVCEKYFLYKLEERTCVSLVDNIKQREDGDYVIELTYDVDYMHAICYEFADGKAHSHWCSPKLIEGNKVLLNKNDVESYLKDMIENKEVYLRYVAKCEFPNEARDDAK